MINILITGAKGFVGKNLCVSLKNIRDGFDKTRPNIQINDIYEYDVDSDPASLDEYCKNADFVFKSNAFIIFLRWYCSVGRLIKSLSQISG